MFESVCQHNLREVSLPDIFPKIFNNDPVFIKSYVNRKVTVTADDGNVHVGIMVYPGCLKGLIIIIITLLTRDCLFGVREGSPVSTDPKH